jgi:hypothetical protein
MCTRETYSSTVCFLRTSMYGKTSFPVSLKNLQDIIVYPIDAQKENYNLISKCSQLCVLLQIPETKQYNTNWSYCQDSTKSKMEKADGQRLSNTNCEKTIKKHRMELTSAWWSNKIFMAPSCLWIAATCNGVPCSMLSRKQIDIGASGEQEFYYFTVSWTRHLECKYNKLHEKSFYPQFFYAPLQFFRLMTTELWNESILQNHRSLPTFTGAFRIFYVRKTIICTFYSSRNTEI